jgi:hypothetical protein
MGEEVSFGEILSYDAFSNRVVFYDAMIQGNHFPSFFVQDKTGLSRPYFLGRQMIKYVPRHCISFSLPFYSGSIVRSRRRFTVQM